MDGVVIGAIMIALVLVIAYLWFCRDIVDTPTRLRFLGLFSLTTLPLVWTMWTAGTCGAPACGDGPAVLGALWLFVMFLIGAGLKHWLMRPRKRTGR
jgi:hypothetical protein